MHRAEAGAQGSVAMAFGVSGYSGAGVTPSDKNNPEVLRDNLLPYALVGHIHEREATHRALSLSEIVEVPVVIVHVSNGPAIDEIRRARERGDKVIGETCPQYLLLTADDLDTEGWDGAKFVCSPPPRDAESQVACWEGIKDGTLELFSSDHCPFCKP